MIFEEKTIKSDRIYEGSILNLRRDKVTVLHGTSYREIVEHNGGAVLAAITDEGKMVMVRQFRKPAERVMLEVPAGKIDPGEKPEETAKRELAEETGYRARHVRYLTEFYPSVGYAEEVLYLYLCTGLTPGETNFDENEAHHNIGLRNQGHRYRRISDRGAASYGNARRNPRRQDHYCHPDGTRAYDRRKASGKKEIR